MFLERLELNDFRSWEQLRLQFEAPLTILAGANGQGKTNILEAVLLLAQTRSPRTGRDSELVRRGQREAVVRGEIRRQRGAAGTVAVALRSDGSKVVKIDGQPVRRLVDAVGALAVVFFGPDELRLVSGGPETRRNYLNGCLGQLSPRYLAALAGYRGVLRQRNQLLRSARERPVGGDLLAAFDDGLAAQAAILMAERCRGVEQLSRHAATAHYELSAGAETLQVTYRPHVSLPAEPDPERLQTAVLEQLARRRDEELRRATTLVGPHRDDLAIRLNEVEARTYGSQGQQRTAALALKMAELRVLSTVLDEPAVLLLDDVLSELDDTRRRQVLALIDETDQVVVTCAQTSGFDERSLARSSLWEVAGGAVVARSSP
ncbi:MAG: DNA replication/repair protein RecF [Fimbriimonadaceae bacterium]|nr:DNA replication/repair protein RecF [Fimbriimonadaceae bacterium]